MSAFTCHHEAGHAILWWYFGGCIEEVQALSPADFSKGKVLRDSRGAIIPALGNTVVNKDFLKRFCYDVVVDIAFIGAIAGVVNESIYSNEPVCKS